ncbi:MAG: hypothetical protein GWN84_15210 [Gammaproteobacteria bacterium]|nr:hypothetical protein [Gammaproteobacteria bacterium]NIR84140.1 hypothetical protein [Gammaproteobacteria bacterium]NIR89452.1 hypothetical protein [Gammaproteobacteria bacterium]NIU05295.1 hypothetical protein [Gammaproteobacteria bacterium]NIV52235.1 hypothetical protein [Gammaproteobacteria bacterium]
MTQERGSLHRDAAPERHDSVLVILLGASNLSRGHRALVRHLEAALAPRPTQFLTAAGPGRGYCAKGGFLYVTYPPIPQGGILEASRARSREAHTVALITDIGNDIMQGVTGEEIVQCLDALIAELRALGARVVVTAIPVDPKKDLNEAQFRLLRAIFFPRSPVDRRQARAAVRTVNDFLLRQQSADVHVVHDLYRFTGWDKIHYGIFKANLAWSRVAEELLRCLGLPAPRRITRLRMLASVARHLIRLLTRDLLRSSRADPGFF